MAIVTTTGEARNFTTSALLGLGATSTDPNGRFYIDGSMVNVELSRVIAEVLYINEIFRDGQSVTRKYTTDPVKNGAVRILLDTPLPFSSRTTEYGGRNGTAGNSGVINKNGALLPASDEFMVYLNQINDQALLFPDVTKEYIPLDVVASKVSQYVKRVQMDRDASTLAEILAYNIFRAMNGGNNLVSGYDLTQQYAFGELISDLHTKLDAGDEAQGAYTYPTEGRTIIGRPSFINKALNIKSGLIVDGGDLAQKMLASYSLDTAISERGFVGTGYKGNAAGFNFVSCPNAIWKLAARYLGLAENAFDGIDAICVSYEATAVATGVDLGMKMIDATEVRGVKAQPLNMWGHEAFRISYILGANISNATFTALGFDELTRRYPVAPSQLELGTKISVPVYDADGVTIVGYREIASVPNPNGGNISTGVVAE